MSCHYESRAAHLKLTPNNLEEEQGKKTQTHKEAIQYTLLFKLASPGTVSVHKRGTLKRDTQHTQRQQETPGGTGVVRKAKQKQKKRVDLVIPGRRRKQLLN